MNTKIRTLITLMLLLCIGVSEAMPYDRNNEGGESWWGYFNGDYNSVIKQGMGSGMPYPLTYNCAIKLENKNAELVGRRIKAFKFAFSCLDYIDDVKVWMSTYLPLIPEDADICCQHLPLSSLVGLEEHSSVNEVAFEKPYQFGPTDVYVGYSFTVTSDSMERNTYPLAVTDSFTSDNAFFVDWGSGWNDYSGNDYGNLAVMILTDNDGAFIRGDVNYDLKVNVGDLSATIEYILSGGKVIPFNVDMADVDGSGEVNIVDAASITDIILGRYVENRHMDTRAINDRLTVSKTACGTDVILSADDDYKAFQMDVTLPEGAEMTSLDVNGELALTHSVRYASTGKSRYRIAAYSLAGSVIPRNTDKLITIATTGGEVKIDNVIFATSDLGERRFEALYGSGVTGIANAETDESVRNVYDVNGIRQDLVPGSIRKGFYITDGNKVVLR